jgi:Mrp family chromosome partitioning ATPase
LLAGRPSAGRAVSVPFTPLSDMPEDVVREMTSLRMSLEATLAEQTPRVVMLTSAQRGEGTTTVTRQFASALSRDERLRVLVIDMNARRPGWGESRNGANRAVTAGQTPGDGRLHVLCVDSEHARAGLIAPAAAREIVQAQRARFDWILLDGPPVLESPDAASLAAIADGAVVVVQAGRTKRPVLNRAVDLLRKAGARLMGSILNRRLMEIPDFIYRRI